KFVNNLLIQISKGLVSISDVAGRVDSETKQKEHLEIAPTPSPTIVNANAQLTSCHLRHPQ
ncbi:hypothetical protein PENTCL1PPCAC_8813, partial [Pristionchus entomophagus]